MNPKRILPIMLAAGLQVMPMLRAVMPIATQGLAPSTWAIILKFAAGSVALLGSHHAVSGATAIVAPYTVNATVGTRYTRQLGTSGQTAHSWSASTAPVKSAVYPLTPGLFLTNTTGKIGGIPTWAGTSNIVIKAWENTGNSGASVSATFVFTITNSSSGTLPAITQQPQGQTVAEGQTASFSITATGTAPLAYYWRKGSAIVQAGSSASYTINNVLLANAGTYSVVVSNAAGIATSSNAVLAVNAAVTQPSITQHPQPQTVTAGQAATFSVTATGTAPLAYYWRKGTAVVQTGGSASYTISNAQPGDDGTYSVIVSNSAGVAISGDAALTVVVPVAITAEPVDQIVTAGANVTLEVAATGSPITYQWRFNSNLIVGATSATLNLTNVTLAGSGHYSVIVANSANSVNSHDARLLVSAPPSKDVAPLLQPGRFAAGQFQFSFGAAAGYRHIVQYNNSLDTNTWITLTNIPAEFNGTTITLPQNVAESPNRFYRVLLLGN